MIMPILFVSIVSGLGEAPACKEMEQDGHLRFPTSGETYENDAKECWRFTCPQNGNIVAFTIIRMDLTAPDFLDVFESNSSTPILRIRTETDSFSATPDVTLQFESDSSLTSTGFELDYRCTAATPTPATSAPEDGYRYPSGCVNYTEMPASPGVSGSITYNNNEGEQCWALFCERKVNISVQLDGSQDSEALRLSWKNSKMMWDTTPIVETVSTYAAPVVLRTIRADPSLHADYSIKYACVDIDDGMVVINDTFPVAAIVVPCALAVLIVVVAAVWYCTKGKIFSCCAAKEKKYDVGELGDDDVSLPELEPIPEGDGNPEHMVCPLTRKLINDPVSCVCSPPHSFECEDLHTFVAKFHCCPVGRKPLLESNISKNSQLKREIFDYVCAADSPP